MMNTLMLLVLAVALGEMPCAGVRTEEVAFSALPEACVREYDSSLAEWRKAKETMIRRFDIDGDGADELLVWSGEAGSGGEGWSVMTRRSGAWRCAGRIFGVVYFVDRPPQRGLVVESPCGWRYADWEYFELENGVLKSRIKLAIRYRKPEGNILRTRPEEIIVKEK
jgi:hypothetical protein